MIYTQDTYLQRLLDLCAVEQVVQELQALQLVVVLTVCEALQHAVCMQIPAEQVVTCQNNKDNGQSVSFVALSIEVGNLVLAGITLKSGNCCVPFLEA